VGQLIGEQRAEDARRSSHASFLFSGIIQTVLTVILLLCKDVLGHLFSKDEEVATLVSELIPISCLFMMGDAIQATIGGVFRGLGRQKFVLWLNILAFWVCAVPIGAVLTFVEGVGVAGLWWGFNIGIFASSAVGIWFLRMRVDWTLEAIRAMKRLSTLAETNSNSSFPVDNPRMGSPEVEEATFQVESL
jgi:MATE family multidrug resistance protein